MSWAALAGTAPAESRETRTAPGSGSPEPSLSVPSIHCQGCVGTIEANLRLEPGNGGIEGDVKSKTIRVAYDASDTSPDAIEAAVTRLGHRVEKRSA